MAYSTFNQEKNDPLKEPMFFGNPVNVARYDQQKFEIFLIFLSENPNTSRVFLILRGVFLDKI